MEVPDVGRRDRGQLRHPLSAGACRRCCFSSFTNRIFLAAALLVVLAIGVTAAFVSARVTAQAEAELQRGLVESGAVVARQSEALLETFTLMARLTADLPRLKAAVATGDPPTVQPLAWTTSTCSPARASCW